jgi:hypothetical protein
MLITYDILLYYLVNEKLHDFIDNIQNFPFENAHVVYLGEQVD